MMGLAVNWRRVRAVMVKEFIQLRRDRLTFAMMLGVPLLQLILFGYAINNDPRNLPTAVLVEENNQYTRSFLNALENSRYYKINSVLDNHAQAQRKLETGAVTFVVTIPAGFGRDLLRGDRPQLLIQADATDPAATSNAVSALEGISRNAFRHEFRGPLAALNAPQPAVDVVIHRLYNPESISTYNIVPGLIGVILTMTMIMMTALTLTRETENGTLENLLSMPVTPLEVMLGKVAPYVCLGLFQVTVILITASLLFGVPIVGSVILLFLVALVFISANVFLGFTLSTFARTQLQAMQMTFFVFLPTILLSGFMFPFRGMPQWAQYLGEILPLTHFLRMVRGIVLKGNGVAEILPELWPILLFLVVVGWVALLRYRRTLD